MVLHVNHFFKVCLGSKYVDANNKICQLIELNNWKKTNDYVFLLYGIDFIQILIQMSFGMRVITDGVLVLIQH